jgi:hypothetical protein
MFGRPGQRVSVVTAGRPPTLALIDPPSPYDKLETWEQYLTRLKKLPENVLLRRESIAQAEHTIRRKRKGT